MGNGADSSPIDFGDDAVVDVQKVYLRWFDYWLKGMDNGVATELPIKIFIMRTTTGALRTSGRSRERLTPITYIHSNGKANSQFGDGTLPLEAPADSPSDSLTYDPDHPVPSMGGNVC